MTTAERIKDRRTQQGKTQDEMEKLTGIDQGHISMIETGRRKRISADIMVKIARALGCTVEDLVASRLPMAAGW